MPPSGRIERCCRCSNQLFVPDGSNGTYVIRCTVCQAINRFSSYVNRISAPPGYMAGRGRGYRLTRPYHPVTYNQPPLPPPLPPTRPLQPLASTFGRKRAVICGVSHFGKRYNIKGSINDVKCMKYFLMENMGFPLESILTLTEEERNPMRIPTKENMRMAMRWLVQGCQSGDSLVFYYSGHGSKTPDSDMDEISGFDQTLCPLDFETSGMLIDDEINHLLVRPLTKGATLHAIVDSCFSGSVLDLPFICKINREGNFTWKDERFSPAYKGTSGGLALCFSACRDDQVSMDTTAMTGSATGALTYCLIQALQNEPGMTYGRLLIVINNLIHKARSGGFQISGQVASVLHKTTFSSDVSQEPQLSSSAKFDIYSRQFIL